MEALRCVVTYKLTVTSENPGKLAWEVVYEGDSLYGASFSCAGKYWIDIQFWLLAIVCFKNTSYFKKKNYSLILPLSYPLGEVISETLSNLLLFSLNCCSYTVLLRLFQHFVR